MKKTCINIKAYSLSANAAILQPASSERVRLRETGHISTKRVAALLTGKAGMCCARMRLKPHGTAGEFATLDLRRIKGLLNYPIVIDGRNLYAPEEMAKAGFNYYNIGRSMIESTYPMVVQHEAED